MRAWNRDYRCDTCEPCLHDPTPPSARTGLAATLTHVEQLEDPDRLIADERPGPERNAQDVAERHEHDEHRGPEPDVIGQLSHQGRHDRPAGYSGAQDSGERAVIAA